LLAPLALALLVEQNELPVSLKKAAKIQSVRPGSFKTR
jgi:hypothetical protein